MKKKKWRVKRSLAQLSDYCLITIRSGIVTETDEYQT